MLKLKRLHKSADIRHVHELGGPAKEESARDELEVQLFNEFKSTQFTVVYNSQFLFALQLFVFKCECLKRKSLFIPVQFDSLSML